MDLQTTHAFRRLLVRAALQAEDGSVAALSHLERLCRTVAEEDPALSAVATEHDWRLNQFRDPIGARDFVISRVLGRYSVRCAILTNNAA